MIAPGGYRLADHISGGAEIPIITPDKCQGINGHSAQIELRGRSRIEL